MPFNIQEAVSPPLILEEIKEQSVIKKKVPESNVKAVEPIKKPAPIKTFGASLSKLIPCPHCNRTFNTVAAERHIPACKEMKHKPKSPPKPEDI